MPKGPSRFASFKLRIGHQKGDKPKQSIKLEHGTSLTLWFPLALPEKEMKRWDTPKKITHKSEAYIGVPMSRIRTTPLGWDLICPRRTLALIQAASACDYSPVDSQVSNMVDGRIPPTPTHGT